MARVITSLGANQGKLGPAVAPCRAGPFFASFHSPNIAIRGR